jgi:hypothetical protein
MERLKAATAKTEALLPSAKDKKEVEAKAEGGISHLMRPNPPRNSYHPSPDSNTVQPTINPRLLLKTNAVTVASTDTSLETAANAYMPNTRRPKDRLTTV